MIKLRIGVLLFSFLLLGCLRGTLVVDQYWDAIMRSRGMNPSWVANNNYVSYYVISGRTIEDVEKEFHLFVDKQRPDKNLIFSPWLGSLLEKKPTLSEDWGVLTTHGLANEGTPLKTVKLSRSKVLEEIAKESTDKKENVLLLYSEEQDYKLLSMLMNEGIDFFSLAINEKSDIDQAIEQSIAIMGLREVQTLIIFAEPWNFLILNGLSFYLQTIKNVYSTGVIAGYKSVKLLSEELDEQIKSLLNDKTQVIQAYLEN